MNNKTFKEYFSESKEDGSKTPALYLAYRRKLRGENKFLQQLITDSNLAKYEWEDAIKAMKSKPHTGVVITISGKQIFALLTKKQFEDDYEYAKAHDAFSGNWITVEDSKNRSKDSWAILSAVNPYGRNHTEYGFISNDGSKGSVVPLNVFKQRAKKAADDMAGKYFKEHIGGSAKIYTDKEKFIADYKKLTGRTPNV